MKKYFEQLRPMERRLVVGVAVILFIVTSHNRLFWSAIRPGITTVQCLKVQA